ncbi:hypothetical protein CLAFUW4_02429 [Fulvia fulva]|nr:hypothetical protein CLAFUR4_02424 [Fulvia fulva]KAK4634011.1 hypothetical protein CLAFUR0_02428 [Fulvia fulva]WPV11606.1 hypothetical protein CLAFUW4_02429 [Fulvia fulva]WPV26469.1 hypothetical protein CLAFUW7_02429 [Fulvia fulva]
MSHDRREPKRARQACLNCRRKKARCSGKKPVCAFCARLKQNCEWDSPSAESTARPSISRSGSSGRDAVGLAARVALLEAKLSLLSAREIISYNKRPAVTGNEPSHARTSARKRPLPQEVGPDSSSYDGDYASAPSQDVFHHLIDVYLEYFHNQPYTYFHEATFRQKYDEGRLPEYLVLAFAAMAVRFSNHEMYRGRQQEALTAYANASWQQIFEDSFSYGGHLEYPMVPATAALLAVVDFTTGHTKFAWVKFSLTIRFAQGLRLNEEPDEDLPGIEQEERRRTYWSVYLLDTLISIGPSRPPSISNPDCPVRLPCQEDLFCNGPASETEPTLGAVIDDPTAPCHQDLDYFDSP